MLFGLVVSAQPAVAQEPVVENRTQPREHVVRRGDTLWGLARTYLMNAFLWPRIFDANRSVVEDPHWIYPNERLMIPGLEDTLAVPISVTERPAGIEPSGMTPATPSRSRFYQPPAPLREEREEVVQQVVAQEMPYIVTPAEHAAAPWLADTAALGTVGQMIRLADPTRRNDKLPSRLHPYDHLYVGRMRGAAPAPGTELLIVGVRDEVEGFGNKVVPVARVSVVEPTRDGFVAAVTHQYGEAKAGDLVIPAPGQPSLPRGVPSDVSDGARGQLLAFLDEDPLKGNPDMAFIDMGSGEVGLGDLLTVYLPEDIAGGSELQTARIARLKVIRTESSSATVRVLQVENTGLAHGMPVRVTQRSP
jgi:hypothetical protein